jgi:ferredoxin
MAERLRHQGAPSRCTTAPAPAADRRFDRASPRQLRVQQVCHHFATATPRRSWTSRHAWHRAAAWQPPVCLRTAGFMDAVLATARAARAGRRRSCTTSTFRRERDRHQWRRRLRGPAGELGPGDPVQAAGQTVVKAFRPPASWCRSSCEQGVCGTCLTRVLSGRAGPPRPLPDAEEEQAANDQFLPCCSRAASPRLVLDL